jgi:transketolase
MTNIDNLTVNTIRGLSMDMVQKANSGHPGAPMGLAPAAYVLWTKILKHNPKNPNWLDRDRFVLSGGHASALLYSLLYLTGYDLSLDDLKNFRQWRSKTPGHPEYGHTQGVETTTGPLGQGIANAVGMAMAERHLAAKFNKEGEEIVDHFTYVICGDGDLMEGIASEAASFAGNLGLERLTCVYDANNISIEGNINITFTENVAKRFEAYGWHIIIVNDGNDIKDIENAFKAAKEKKEKPKLIILKTHIAYGSPNKQDTADAHGAPLGEEEIQLTKKNLGLDPDLTFNVSKEVKEHCKKCIKKGEISENEWEKKYDKFAKKYPDAAEKFISAIERKLPLNWDSDIPLFSASDSPIATRSASGKILNSISKKLDTLMGGSADLAPSNKTFLEGVKEFQKSSYEGRNIRFGVREHAMGGIMNGISLHKGIRPYGGTFLVFADYMRPSIRLAALMKQPVIYIFTHDSIAVGEDGPTHQPVEHLASLRNIPNLTVIRPSDASETDVAWRLAIETSDSPIVLALSRQKLPILDRNKYASAKGLEKGAYILSDPDKNSDKKPDIILIGTGAELHVAIDAKNIIEKQGIVVRIVSMPSWELFEKCDNEYKEKVLPSDIKKRIAIEAGISAGWERYVKDEGCVIAINEFGASAPGGQVLENFGFTAENVVKKAMEMM